MISSRTITTGVPGGREEPSVSVFFLSKTFPSSILILVGVLLLISKPLELAPGNWKPDTTQVFQESEEEETALNGMSIEEGKVLERKNTETDGSSRPPGTPVVIVLEDINHDSTKL